MRTFRDIRRYCILCIAVTLPLISSFHFVFLY
uniref:Uncharacterized protein n=1 Tax=Arundo donax TaxID=35708 RepID=A0A0A9BIA8_ARUDO